MNTPYYDPSMEPVQEGFRPGRLDVIGLPPERPRKRHHWVRWTAAGTGALIVAFVAIGVAGGSDGGTAGPVISSPATSVSLSPDIQTPTFTDPFGVTCAPSDEDNAGYCTGDDPASPDTTAGSTVQDWAFSSGYKKMVSVQDDVENVSADASALNTALVEADGAILAQDARAAAQDPPPFDAADYTDAMLAYASSGDEMAAGNFPAATLLLRHGTDLLGKVVAQIPQDGA